jgi:hypothetical protein
VLERDARAHARTRIIRTLREYGGEEAERGGRERFVVRVGRLVVMKLQRDAEEAAGEEAERVDAA